MARGQPHLWLGVTLAAVLGAVTLTDLERRTIPDRILLPAAVLAVAILGLAAPEELPEHFLAGLGAGGFLLAAALVRPGGMGMGDVKLAAVMGLYLGRMVAPAMLFALLAGTAVGALIVARRGLREGRKAALPFGAFLALGGVLGMVVGPAVLGWYATRPL
ncbi:MAG: prepilin peptidase [Solirubrobacteraceae bacterium]